MRVGVLAVQGAVSEHINMLEKCGVEGVSVKRQDDLSNLDALIIPGGESTTIGRLVRNFGLDKDIIKMAEEGTPIYGTCAGMILLAGEIEGENPHLGLMNLRVVRNAFGRQKDSFEADLNVPDLGDEPFTAVFIRAPYVSWTGPEVEVLCRFQDNVVAARQGNLLVTSFHPELTQDERFHRYLIAMAEKPGEME
ncbi:pyridoxal 5'-phosphate synthase glutaminase subunit PdxT [Candidatus Contubernalis alkaliaceticus]|uniref:pyridoxal 5'-phosphate synthase glutaminase subunit PdxT n=1 Tax=Candidatus Contubernalis alkaliaceticus TaxID=338645 RepID=UPI00240994A0|nr:pyridoxal 5'-phosphate synthase glutaminase subunit PdxT [Candidatus Contubernalis alkalaceticus]UNC90632.1 pyridoxal 5'-phosphate synthase glutaminase subunit PdxT [Candidatus Contubernalis alkalaceticus]